MGIEGEIVMEKQMMFKPIPEHAENIIDNEFLKIAPHQECYHHSISEAIKYMMSDNETLYFTFGPKGCGKTFTVRQVLEELGIKYTFHQYKNGIHNIIGDGKDIDVFDDLHYLCEDAFKTGNSLKVIIYLKKIIRSKRAIVISEYPLNYYKLGEEYNQLIQKIERSERFLDVLPLSYIEYMSVIDFYKKKFNVVVDGNCAFFIYQASHKIRFLTKILNHFNGELTEKHLIELCSGFYDVITKSFNAELYSKAILTYSDYDDICLHIENLEFIEKRIHTSTRYNECLNLALKMGYEYKYRISTDKQVYFINEWVNKMKNYYSSRLPLIAEYNKILDIRDEIRYISSHIYRMFSDRYIV